MHSLSSLFNNLPSKAPEWLFSYSSWNLSRETPERIQHCLQWTYTWWREAWLALELENSSCSYSFACDFQPASNDTGVHPCLHTLMTPLMCVLNQRVILNHLGNFYDIYDGPTDDTGQEIAIHISEFWEHSLGVLTWCSYSHLWAYPVRNNHADQQNDRL